MLKNKIRSILLILFLGAPLVGIMVNSPMISGEISQEYRHELGISPRAGSQATRDLSNETHLEEFFDSYIPNQLSNLNVAGMTLSLVQGNETTLAKGYGSADISEGKDVDPNATLFRVGSISKMLTWTAILQLMEAGQLDLHTDVNTYLTSLKVPETFEEPITLHHLMTHTAGFEETYERIIWDSDVFPSLEEVLREGLPPRVTVPGTVTSYSNFGTALVGLLIQDVTGVEFADYVDDHIITPLQMDNSTFLEPIPSSLSDDMSKGYMNINGQLEEGFFEYFPIDPASSFSSTAADMAKLMIAFLNNGSYDGSRILENDTVALMQSPKFQPHDDFPSIYYGFYELGGTNVTMFGHGGDTAFFHSQMMLFPEFDTGIFMSYNTLEGASAPYQLINSFLHSFFNLEDPESPIPMENSGDNLKRFEGNYDTTRRPYLTPDKLIHEFLVSAPLQILAEENGTLTAFGLEFVQIEKNLFQDTSGYGLKLFFTENEKEQIQYMYINEMSITAYEKMAWYDEHSFHIFLMVFVPSILLISVLYWTGEAIYKKIKAKKAPEKQKEPEPITKQDISVGNVFKEKGKKEIHVNWPRIAILAEFIILIVEGLWFLLLINVRFIPNAGYKEALMQLLILPYFQLILIGATCVFGIMIWFGKGFLHPKRKPNIWEKIHYSVLILFGIAGIWLISYWNLLGFHFPGV